MSYWFDCLAGFGRTVELKIALSLVQKMIKNCTEVSAVFLFLGEEVVQDDAL